MSGELCQVIADRARYDPYSGRKLFLADGIGILPMSAAREITCSAD
jgi:hypothetical protein